MKTIVFLPVLVPAPGVALPVATGRYALRFAPGRVLPGAAAAAGRLGPPALPKVGDAARTGDAPVGVLALAPMRAAATP